MTQMYSIQTKAPKGMEKFYRYVFKCILFLCLTVCCYFYYLKEAIENYEKGSTTVTKRSMDLDLEYPALTICANPAFKPTAYKKYNFGFPIRDLFTMNTDTMKQIYQDYFHNKTVPALYEEFSYDNDLSFIFGNVKLFPGVNQNDKWADQEVILTKIPASSLGTCHLLQFDYKKLEINETTNDDGTSI